MMSLRRCIPSLRTIMGHRRGIHVRVVPLPGIAGRSVFRAYQRVRRSPALVGATVLVLVVSLVGIGTRGDGPVAHPAKPQAPGNVKVLKVGELPERRTAT